MNKPQDLKHGIKIKFPSAMKQQVMHSTFRLSAKAHDAIKALSMVYPKHAEVFDSFAEHIKTKVEIYDRILKIPKQEIPEGFKDPGKLALKICFDDFSSKLVEAKKYEKLRKTYVLRKETVDNLEKYLKQLKKTKIKINRDSLIEAVALIFKEKLDEEQAKIPQLYRTYLKEIASLWHNIESLEYKINSELVSYDPFDLIGRINYEVCGLMNLHQDLESFLAEEGKQ